MKPGKPRLAAGTRELRCQRWPARSYYVSPRHRLLYCPVPKVACSSLKYWWAENEEGPLDIETVNLVQMHRDFSQRFTYDQCADLLGDGPLDDPRWFRFAFVRNPWARLVSAFVNKFVQWSDIAPRLIEKFRGALPRRVARQWLHRTDRDDRILLSWLLRDAATWSDQFTFRQFVNHLATSDVSRADAHWRPQSLILGNIDYHFVGRFEQLDRDFAKLMRMLGRQGTLKRINSTQYVVRSLSNECVADWPLSRLRELPAAPSYRRFYTPSLVETVAEIYREDIERFEYAFEETSPRQTVVPLRRAA